MIGTFDPSISDEFTYYFEYLGHDHAKSLEFIDINFPEVNGQGINNILRATGKEMMPLSITLLWNMQLDLDLELTCTDDKTINFEQSLSGEENECGAVFETAMGTSEFD